MSELNKARPVLSLSELLILFGFTYLKGDVSFSTNTHMLHQLWIQYNKCGAGSVIQVTVEGYSTH